MEVNGEGIYKSLKWREHNDTASHGVEHGVFYTQGKDGAVYAFALNWPPGNVLQLTQPITSPNTRVEMLGCKKPMAWKAAAAAAAGTGAGTRAGTRAASVGVRDAAQDKSAGMVITVPALMPTELPSLLGPWVFKMTGV